MTSMKDVSAIVDWRLCVGCGACAYICPDARIGLVDFFNEGIRPVIAQGKCLSCRSCLDVCPAVRTVLPKARTTLEQNWGPIESVWEGYASDSEIRFKGSSGGVLTAISLYCLERLGMHGVLHIAQDPSDPIRNVTKLSRSRSELLAATGSRYSPASVCNGLGLVEAAPAPCVVIGKPAEIAGLKNACSLKPRLETNLGVSISFFCAETPSTAGTVSLLRGMGYEPKELAGLRYRGIGWPGYFAPVRVGEGEALKKIPYRESWSILQAFRPWSVQLWPDGSGELADLSCGDPWYEKPDGNNPGISLVVVRSKRGRQILDGAIDAGYITMTPAENWKLEKSQAGLLAKKGSIWGRRLALRICMLPLTKITGGSLFLVWMRLSLSSKARSLFGTLRRILFCCLFRPLRLDWRDASPVRDPTNRQRDAVHVPEAEIRKP